MSTKSKQRKGVRQGSAKTSPGRPRRSRKRAYKTAALFAASILFSLVIGELAVWVYYDGKFGRRPGFYVSDELLGWKPAANLNHTFFGSDYSTAVKTDADGYRLGGLGEVDYSKRLVVLCGDSFTFGWGVSSDETFASYLDEQLAGASDGDIRVVNLGVGGYGLVQQCDRLKIFLETHKTTRIEALIVQHSPNDATDNLKEIGYHAGTWATKTTEKPRSFFNLVNLVAFARERARQRKSAPAQDTDTAEITHPYLQDMLFAYERQGQVIYLPEVVTVGRRQLSLTEFKRREFDVKKMLQSETLTELQRNFMVASIECIEGLLKKRGTRVFHTFIYTTPDWYIDEVTELAGQTHTSGPNIITLGRVPKPGEYEGPIQNQHSGGHFSPEFNEFWARSALALLREHGLY